MMTKLTYGSIALVVAAAVAIGCDNKRTGETSTTETRSAPGTPQGGPRVGEHAASLASEDKEFLTKATQGSMLEVDLGRQVSGKATSPAVKSYADRMVTDHGKALDELRTLASKKGVVLPSKLEEDKREMLSDMSKLSGARLDQEYAKEMVDDHEKDVDEFREASKDLKDPEIRAWAQKTLGTLESHLAQAKDVKAKTMR